MDGEARGNIVPTQGCVKGVKASGSGPRVSHLLFADDSLVFGEASIEGLNMWGKS